MEPRIQYARTADGVSIAYWTLGDGRAFVHMPWFRMSHIQLEWQIPEVRRWYEGLASGRRLVRYDGRGIGLSERDVSDYSLDALVRDLEAVVDRAGLDTFDLFGILHTGPVAIAYAARHPERVSHLVLWCTYARGSDYSRSTEIQATRGFMDMDWQLYTETVANVRLGWSAGEPARRFAKIMRESITPEALQASIAAFAGLDVTPLLTEVRCPTLVLHRREVSWLGVDVARDLAARIPDAQLTVLEGGSGAPYLGDTDAAMAAIEGFVGTTSRRRRTQPEAAHGTAVILFADVADSVALTEEMGDSVFRKKARALDVELREAIGELGGAAVDGKLLGDGVLAVFSSARQAIEAAVSCASAGSDAGLPLHLGLHAGDVIREESNVYGGAVNIASRISGLAAPGEVLVSETVRSLARTSGGVSFEDRGRRRLKGVGEAVRVWAVRQG